MSEVQENTTPWRRDPAAIEDAFHRWARSIRGDAAVVSEFRMPASGMANDTVLFRVDGEPRAARLAPAPGSPYPTFPTFDLEFQRRVIDLVRERTDVPAPEVVHLERSEDWVGVPFLVVRAIDGLVPSDSPPYLLDPGGVAEQYGLPPVPPMFRTDEAVATYEHITGEELDRLAWYEAFAGLRFGIILARMSQRSIAFGVQQEPAEPNDLMMFPALLERLLEEI